MEIIQDKNRRSALIGTLLFLMLLFLFLFLIKLTYQDPPPINEGAMLINFGDAGGGSSSKETIIEESSASSPSENTETTISEVSAQEHILNTTHQTVEVNASNTVPQEETPAQEVSSELDNALNSAWNNTGDNSNDGNENGNSTNGGNGNGNSYGDNTGPTSGIAYNLGGRGKVSFKKPNNPTQEDGTVVVDIVVDKYGNVIKATPGSRGSTTTNPELYKQAKEAALKAKFTKKIDAITDQKGTMTFIFILQ